MTIEIEECVINDIRARRELGRMKYGKTMERDDLGLAEFLRHAYEECLDQAIYLKRAMRDLRKTSPSPMEAFTMHPEASLEC